MKKRQRLIVEAIDYLGGEASMQEISEVTGLRVNGISQSLGSVILEPLVENVRHGGSWQGGNERYRLVDQSQTIPDTEYATSQTQTQETTSTNI